MPGGSLLPSSFFHGQGGKRKKCAVSDLVKEKEKSYFGGKGKRGGSLFKKMGKGEGGLAVPWAEREKPPL